MIKLFAVAFIALSSVGALAYSTEGQPLTNSVDEAKVGEAMDARLHQLLLDLRAKRQQ